MPREESRDEDETQGEYYVLMERINAVVEESVCFAQQVVDQHNSSQTVVEVSTERAISELGLFTVFVADAENQVVQNCCGGAFQRVKRASSDEGGICAGHGFLDVVPVDDDCLLSVEKSG
ncbi:unnamed protein product [Amoebophrya sp. A120]|nr:unnamed protein product [Amoebophrya sp. A120]|eukprot:GSA120T00017798001.1